MKSIKINGKHNIDKINHVKNPTRIEYLTMLLPDEFYTNKKHIEIINNLYLENYFETDNIIKKIIYKKISGYKNQDIKNEIIDYTSLISLDDTIEKLMLSKLKCYYCKEKCHLLYKNIFEKKQWTLDRIDNTKGHNTDNVLISCLECNIKRGTMDSNRFKKGKDIKIVRKMF
jgi:hypothetical protein